MLRRRAVLALPLLIRGVAAGGRADHPRLPLIAPFAPSSTVDPMGRATAPAMAEILGQPWWRRTAPGPAGMSRLTP